MVQLPPPTVLFRDSRFVVIDKPAGLPVHAGPSRGPSVEDWFPVWRARKDGPWLVHRLDADTAGCLVIALRKSALVTAQQILASGKAQKTYWAVVRGVPAVRDGVIDQPLVKQNERGGWRIVPDPLGMAAVTAWRLRGTDGQRSWLELSPRTGRTHQLRVHCAGMGHPILGDSRYGGGDGPLHLLARSIRLALEPPVEATAEPPQTSRTAFHACGWLDGA